MDVEPVISDRFQWHVGDVVVSVIMCLSLLVVACVFLAIGLSRQGVSSGVGRFVMTVLGVGFAAGAVLFPIILGRRAYEVRAETLTVCNGLRTRRVHGSDVRALYFKGRRFGIGGRMWTAWVELKNGEGFWIRHLIAGSPSRSSVPMPKGQAKLDRLIGSLHIEP
jgi:hypothetical protein